MLVPIAPAFLLKAIAIRRMNTTVKHPEGDSAIGWSVQRRTAAMLRNDRRPRAMAASLHFRGSVALITIALMFVLSCSISLVAAWTILEVVFLLMMRSALPRLADPARLETLGIDLDI
jgi:hypothetical protein